MTADRPWSEPPLLTEARGAYEARRYDDAAALLEPASASLRLDVPEIGFILAASWRQLGRGGEALELTRRLEEPCVLRGSPRLARRRLNLEGMLHLEGGRTAEAETAWLRLLENATAAADAEYVAHACNNLGVVYTVQARGDEALTGYERALAAYHTLDERQGMAQANQNLGIALREKRRHADADERFRTARSLAAEVGDARLVGRIDAERALLLLRRGDAELARATARRAVDEMPADRDPGGAGEAARAAGVIALAGGEADGRELVARGVQLARDVGNPLLEAECRLALAVLDPGAATDELDRARDGFRRIGAAGWGDQMERWLRELAA